MDHDRECLEAIRELLAVRDGDSANIVIEVRRDDGDGKWAAGVRGVGDTSYYPADTREEAVSRLSDWARSRARHEAAVRLRALVTNVETENGHVSAVDLGSIFCAGGGAPDDVSDYKAALAAVASTAGWNVICHSMVSGGAWARHYFYARPPESDAA